MQYQITAPVLRNLKIFFAGLSLTMIGLVIWTSMRQNMFEVSLSQPWFGTTLVDYYFNVSILVSWVCIKESRLMAKILWPLFFITLGSIASCFYVFWQLNKIKPGDSWAHLLLNNSKDIS